MIDKELKDKYRLCELLDIQISYNFTKKFKHKHAYTLLFSMLRMDNCSN